MNRSRLLSLVVFCLMGTATAAQTVLLDCRSEVVPARAADSTPGEHPTSKLYQSGLISSDYGKSILLQGNGLTEPRTPNPEPRLVSRSPLDDYTERLWKANALERSEEYGEAALAYAELPGCEHFAARLAAREPEKVLPVISLAAKSKIRPRNPRLDLVQGEALLSLGRRDEALKCFRRFADRIEREPAGGWEQGFVPASYYPVEPPDFQFGALCRPCSNNEARLPFQCGPGSFRDNLLLRRFIKLRAWGDAAKEFERIRNIHRESAGDEPFSGLSLQFALDYAFFLKTRNQPGRETAVLVEPIPRFDLDRNPGFERGRKEFERLRNAPRNVSQTGAPQTTNKPKPPYLGHCGVTQREYLRIAVERLQALGYLPELERFLEKEIGNGNNATRQVLAFVLGLQGKSDAAVKIESEYLRQGAFDQWTLGRHAARMFEENGRLDAAVAEYENLLRLPPGDIRLSELIESDDDLTLPHRPDPNFGFNPGFGIDAFGNNRFTLTHAEIHRRLARLHTERRDFRKAVESTLARFSFDLKPFTEAELTTFRETAAAVGETEAFIAWAKACREKTSDAAQKALFSWAVADWEATARFYLESIRNNAERHRSPLPLEWRTRMSESGKDVYRAFLTPLIDAHPQNVFLRLELLRSGEAPDYAAEAELLETLLRQDPIAFASSDDPDRGKTVFTNAFEIAEALMDRYVKAGRKDGVLNLALRLASREKPFEVEMNGTQRESAESRSNFSQPTKVLLARAVDTLTDRPDLETLADALSRSPWKSLRERADRKLKLASLPPPRALLGWANQPPGVRLVAGTERILGLCRDDNRIYAGHPWGVSMYDFQGNFIARVATGTAATHLITLNEALWIGTANGLLRMDCKTFALARLPLNWGVMENREGLICDENEDEANPTDPSLKSDTVERRNQVHALAAQGDFLWIASGSAVLKYHTVTGEMRVFPWDELGAGAEAVRPRFLFEGPFVWVFSRLPWPGAWFRYDPETDAWAEFRGIDPWKLEDLELRDGGLWVRHIADDGTTRLGRLDSRTMQIVPGAAAAASSEVPTKTEYRQLPIPPDGARVLADDTDPSNLYEYQGNREWPFRFNNTFMEKPGDRLRLVSPDGRTRPTTPAPGTDNILGNAVFSVEFEGGDSTIRVCTDHGVGILTRDLEVVETITVKDGLHSNLVLGGVVGGDKWYCTNSTKPYYNNFSVLDLKTRIPQPVGAVEPSVLERLKQIVPVEHSPEAVRNRRKMPWLGGWIFGQRVVNGRLYVWGTRGMLVSDTGELPAALEYTALPVFFPANQDVSLRRQAETAVVPTSPTSDEFRRLLQSDNPYLLARVLASAKNNPGLSPTDRLAAALPLADHPHRRVRGTVLDLLRGIDDPAVLPVLKTFLHDEESGIRAFAGLELAKRGAPADIGVYEAAFSKLYVFLSVGLDENERLDFYDLYAALGATMTSDVLRLFLKYPLTISHHKPPTPFQALGQAVTRDPALLEIMLDPPPLHVHRGVFTGGRNRRLKFFEDVFRFAGKETVPRLRQATESPNEEVRELAARALVGVLGPPAAEKNNVEAAKPSLPRRQRPNASDPTGSPVHIAALTRVCAERGDLIPSSERRENRLWAFYPRYRRWERFASLDHDWPDAARAVPGLDDETIFRWVPTRQALIERMKTFDPALAQPFYRLLAEDSDPENRTLAARRLVQGPLNEREANRKVLKKLLADLSLETAVAAAVGLALLDDPVGQSLVAVWLDGESLVLKRRVIIELSRAGDRTKLVFIRESLRRCASDSNLGKAFREQAEKLLSILPEDK